MDNVLIKLHSDKALYIQIYEYFKKEIETGHIKQGERLPSIRGLARAISVSKITVEKAYDQLFSEGYIQSHERARYTVKPLENLKWDVNLDSKPRFSVLEEYKKEDIKYDFSSGEMDREGFDFSFWRRYLNRAIDNSSRLMRYGNIQGEPELRNEIVRYIHRSRGVSASAEQIIIGPSTQALLGTFCTLMDREQHTVAFEDPGFKHGRQVFLDYGFPVLPVSMTKNGIDMNHLSSSKANIAYVSPSHQFPTGFIMSIGKRNKLLLWAKENNALIIEDDYDSEFRYFGNPIPALKGLDHKDRVVYLGSFSKIIPPSIRISYMLLPENLLEKFHNKSSSYNQTASSLEQFALAEFMADGNLDRQIRRLRKKYQDKRKLFLRSVDKYFGSLASVQDDGSGLFVVMDFKTELSGEEIKKSALEKNCKVALIQDYYMQSEPDNSSRRLILYFSSIPTDEIEKAVKLLSEALIK